MQAAGLGVIGLLAVAILGNVAALSHASTAVVIILDLAALALAFFAGRAARRTGGKPIWKGALVGVVFGAISALGAFFVHISKTQIQQELQKVHSPAPISVAQMSGIVNSPALHAVGVLENAILFGILGLIVGLIGGATTKRDGEQDAV